MIKSMAPDPIVFALANPDPEIYPTRPTRPAPSSWLPAAPISPTRSTTAWPFPASSGCALDIRARAINDDMNRAAAYAIADLVGKDLRPGYILPGAMDFRVPRPWPRPWLGPGMASGVARLTIEPERVARHTREYIYDERLSIL